MVLLHITNSIAYRRRLLQSLVNFAYLPGAKEYQSGHKIVEIPVVVGVVFDKTKGMLAVLDCVHVQTEENRCDAVQTVSAWFT